MEFIKGIVEFVFHIDRHLGAVIQHCGAWSYWLLFLIVFAETGLVVTPFLPGDSLLFAAGAFAAIGSFNVLLVAAVLFAAAVIGDSVNYAIGKKFGEKVFKKHPHIFKKEYLDRTHRFYERYGGKTIVLARFVPIIRTFAPFVAGVGRMSYPYFFIYNVTGGLLWVAIFVFAGFYFGNTPFVKKNFSLVVLVIVVLSVLPVVNEFRKHRKYQKEKSLQGKL